MEIDSDPGQSSTTAQPPAAIPRFQPPASASGPPASFSGPRGPPPRMPPPGRPPPLMGSRVPPPMGGPPRGPPPGFHGFPPGSGGPPSENNGPPRFQMGGPHQRAAESGGGQPSGLSDRNDEMWVETKTAEGKSYFYHSKTRETVWTKPENARVVTQAEFEDIARQNAAKHAAGGSGPPAGPTAGGAAAAASQHPPAFPASGGGFPPPMAQPSGGQGWPPFPPPFMGGMPPFGMPMGPGGAPGPDFNDPASVWTEYFSPEGKPYYFNMATGETTWDKPQILKDREARAKGVVSENEGMKLTPAAKGPAPTAATSFSGTTAAEGGTEQQQKDKSKPISNNPVAGTPWCVVWTGDQKVFFYNPSTRTSVWERPPELYGRPDVDLLVSKPPEPKKVDESKKPETVDHLRSSSQEEEMDIQPVKKKKKTKVEVDTKPKPEPVKRKEPIPVEVKVDVTPKVRDAAMEAELKAAQERAQVPLEVRIQQFKDMLREKDVSAFSTWEKELHKIVFDSRYLMLTSKERKNVFEQYVKDRAEEERTERKKKSKETKENFRSLLLEANLNGKSSFSDFTSKYGKDERFKAIEKSKDREALFSDYVGDLRKKEREEKAVLREKQKEEFLELLKEQENIRKYSKWSEIKKTIGEDPRYKAADSSSLREDWFKDYLKTLPSADSDDEEEEARKERLKEKERKDREEAAQRAREAEVAAELESQLKERGKEIEKYKLQETEDNFRALLADMVRTTDQSWRDWKRQLRKDHRWESADLLDRHEKERLFDEHVKMLEHKKREAFYQLLDETPSVTLTSTWKETKKVIKEDPRLVKFSSSDRKCEREFKEYLQEKLITAKNEFRELVKETKIITYKSKQMIQENEQHLKDILAVLENDKRYLVLECCPDEREKLLESYLDELDKRGPPPPPTASEPSRRGK